MRRAGNGTVGSNPTLSASQKFPQFRSCPRDERQLRVNITAAGRKLQQAVDRNASELVEATGLGKDFAQVQESVARLRDNLLGSVQSKISS